MGCKNSRIRARARKRKKVWEREEKILGKCVLVCSRLS